MANENSEWIIRGVSDDDPRCIKTVGELTEYIEKIGFLPLFRNDIPGFSVEEHTAAEYWWTDHDRDPWNWRMEIAREGRIAYGKFFNKHAGFVSLKWLPYYVNYRRDGYDFEALWEDGLADSRSKKIIDVLEKDGELYSFELKRRAGFGKGGEKNFEGTITDLQYRFYVAVRDFRMRINKYGEPYGWHIAVYSTPEHIWGCDAVTAAFGEDPKTSGERIFEHMREICPSVTDAQMKKVLK